MDGPFKILNKRISHWNFDFRLISLSVLILLGGLDDNRFIFSLIISILIFLGGISYKFKRKLSIFKRIKNQAKLWELISLIFNLIFLIFSFYFEMKWVISDGKKERIFKYAAIEFFYLVVYKVPSYTSLSLIVFSLFISFNLDIEERMASFLVMMNILHIWFRFKGKRKKKVKEIQTHTNANSQSIIAPPHCCVAIANSTTLNQLDLNFPDTSDFILVIDRSKEVIQCNFQLKKALKQANIDTNYFTIYFEEWKFKIMEKLEEFPILEELYEKMLNLFQKKDRTSSDHTLALNDLLEDLFSNKSGEHFYLVLARNKEGKEHFMHLYLDNEHVLLKIKQNCIFQEWLKFRSETTLFANYLTYMEHEFRTPLNCIINILQILEDFIEPEMASTIITPALISSKLLLNSISNFIDFGKIKTYTYENNNVEFDLPSLLYEIMEIVKNRAANRGILIKQNFDDKIRLVKNDPTRIRQVLINLLENALSLTTKGSIILSSQIVEMNQIEISVIDTSTGFFSEDQIKIKEALDFKNLKEIDVLKGHLISLGVLISNNIANHLNGAQKGLIFSSLFNEGSTFSFRFDGYKDMHIEECVTESHRSSLMHLPDYSCKMINEVFFNNNLFSYYYSQGSQSILQSKKDEMGSFQSFLNTKKDELASFSRMSVCSCFSKQNSKLKRSKSSSKNSKNSNSRNSKFIFVSEARSSMEEPHNFMHDENLNLETELQIVRSFVRLRPCQCPLAIIIDDNDFNILALQFQLKRLEIRCEKALSADLGMEMIRDMSNNECCDTFKIIFLDIEMPIKNGFQAYEEIKHFYDNFKLNNLCVVAVTAHGQNSEIVKDVKKTGINEVMSKPLSMESLILLLLKLHKSLILS